MSEGPLVIGGSGGSGTRLFARVAQAAGTDLGVELNESEDQEEIALFHDRWINRRLADRAACEPEMSRELEAILGRHRGDREGPWGWKEPRSIFLLGFLDRTVPGLRFLHVVRDGRDMAFSTNQNQLRKHGDAALGSPGGIAPARSIALWAALNGAAADLGETTMKGRYLRVRFEDLLASPESEISRFLGFLGLGEDVSSIVPRLELARPDSMEAWRSRPPDEVSGLERIGGGALTRFGYLRSM